ncbi:MULTISPECIES: glycosyltransferase 87 family protein [unclassified Beijerinckia]|uniref:glycosyltransferase 87 family protein n=1 Tax=unclassified Beijerinckia TaxID=2638183 RepID=UPI000898032A|nr:MULTISPECIES: glycosyltransferase 87 family protein [unclassified Beijerinckia]MDH7799924.1 alpha-1,2-mannosyltransferase [Beijerinckia sp. GAS462]SED42689.1 Putative flippase GtrA (transmembrane translocase of bactoprenol-linked glucose) [Beijerinckia sp. 28-YEA-48]
MLEHLRTGDWLTRERVRIIAFTLLAFYALSTVLLFATSNGRVDHFDRPLGTDYSQVWTAGRFVLEGHPEKPFDNAVHERRQQEYFSPTSGFFHWGYPPYFLVVAAFFALFPYALSLVLWQAATLPLYLAAVRRIVPVQDGLLVAAAFPAVIVNIQHGHNGFLSAGLMALALLALERRPVMAGILFGLLAYKPQFGVLIPVALVAGGHWRAIVAAGATIAVMTLGTLWAFGWETWRGFFDMMHYSRVVISEQGATGWYKIQTIFAAVRMWGGSIPLAYGVQAVSTLSCAAIVAWMWLTRADRRLAAAAVMTGALLSTPYALDYDMMLLGPALAFVVAYGLEKGFRPWEKTALAFIWAVPLVARTLALATLVPVGQIAMVAFMAIIFNRALAERAEAGKADERRGLMAEIGAFSVVGAIGFAVDAGLTLLFAKGFGFSGYAARVPAMIIAIVVTWLLNRIWTFRSSEPRLLREFARYGAANLLTAVFNFGIYTLVLWWLSHMGLGLSGSAILVALIAGSGAAAVANFVLSKYFSFASGAIKPEMDKPGITPSAGPM